MTSYKLKTNKTKNKTTKNKTTKNKTTKNKTKNKTKKYNRKYSRKHIRKYKTYFGGTTSSLPLTPLTLLTPLTPHSGGPSLPRTSINLDEVKQLLQNYTYNHEGSHSPGRKVVPLSKLEGKGREKGLTYEQQIHSTGDKILNKSKSFSPYKDISASKKDKKTPTYPPPDYPPPAIPPEAVLTSKGNLKTTYTPSLSIVNIYSDHHVVELGISIPRYIMIPFEYNLRVILPLSYMPLRGNIYESLNEEERTMLDTINKYHREYSYLSPYIYNILENLHIADQFGLVLVYGRLRDELIENIRISSIKTIQSRTQFSEENTKEFLKGIVNFSDEIYTNTGPSPSRPYKEYSYETKFFKMPTPKSELSPTSLQVIGYNNHQMYRQNLTPKDVSELVKISEINKNVNGKESIFILAHGGMGSELSPELKILANKYLRVIELGKKHNLLSSKYPSVYLLVNKILLNPDNAVMFENTDVGDIKRKQIFDKICKYLLINSVDACSMKDILSLTEITHDRIFSGHFTDTDIQEDHDVTMNTLFHFYSMGIFKAVDYTKKINRVPIIKKKIFELYPGTTFSTKNTMFELVKTLLPIAVKQNKVMNIVIFSCAVEHKNTDPYIENPDPLYKKPSKVTPAMKLLIEGKKFIYSINKMIAFFVHAFEKDMISQYNIIKIDERYTYDKKFEYFPPGEPPKIFEITQLETNLSRFFSRYFTIFLQEKGPFNYSAVFSFAGIDEQDMSYHLIEDDNPLANTPHINEIIKVKIYLMQELYETFVKVIDYCLAILRDLLEAFTKYYDINLGDAAMLTDISTDIDIVNNINGFFTKLNQTITYITNGFYGTTSSTSPYPIHPQFLRYPKYIEVKKEYDESHVKELYDEINEGMDYDRFRRDIPDWQGFTSKDYFPEPLLGFKANPLPPGEFHHIARNTYKYKQIPNVDKAMMRRKTLKATRSSLIPNPNATDTYHISV